MVYTDSMSTTTNKCPGCDGITKPVKGQSLEAAIAIHKDSCPGYLRRSKAPRRTIEHQYETAFKDVDKGRAPARRNRT